MPPRNEGNVEQNWETVVFHTNTENQRTKEVEKANSQRATPVTDRGVSIRDLEEGEVKALPKATNEFKTAFSEARRCAGLNQKELAQRLNMRPEVIKGWENGNIVPTNPEIAKAEQTLKTKLPRMKKPTRG